MHLQWSHAENTKSAAAYGRQSATAHMLGRSLPALPVPVAVLSVHSDISKDGLMCNKYHQLLPVHTLQKLCSIPKIHLMLFFLACSCLLRITCLRRALEARC